MTSIFTGRHDILRPDNLLREGRGPTRFLRRVSEGLGDMSDVSGARHAGKQGARNQFHVLVVHSNPADTLLTVEAFKAAGLTNGLRCVNDGEDAIKYIRRKGKYSHVRIPDLIFLDLSQPRISALELLRLIKSSSKLVHIPIVVAAGSYDPKFVRAVYELNGNCFIRKPSEIAEFLRFIETCYRFWSKVVTLSPAVGKRAGK